MSNSALKFDFYALTMAQAHLNRNYNPNVVFDMFFRSAPFKGSYTIFAGLDTLLKEIQQISFKKEDIDYLRNLGRFNEKLFRYLQDFSFKGSIFSFNEGSIVFPHEPIMRFEGPLIELLLLEARILNHINYQSLIATKAARLSLAAQGSPIIEMGLRRAYGSDGALSASRAAIIGGCGSTSNTQAAHVFMIPVSGTMAHSWVMSFDSELEAFRAYGEVFPENTTLLLDTYDTLNSGLINAMIIAKERRKNKEPQISVRLDSGDLHFLSSEIRKAFDKEDLNDVKIFASNDLDEMVIEQLLKDQAPIDGFGVGTSLVSAQGSAPLSGVFKLTARQDLHDFWQPLIKISDNITKCTTPGRKQVYRFFDEQNFMIADYICSTEEPLQKQDKLKLHHPMEEFKNYYLSADSYSYFSPQLTLCYEKGHIIKSAEIDKIQLHCQNQLGQLQERYRRFLNPHIYKVSLSSSLKNLKFSMIRNFFDNLSPERY